MACIRTGLQYSVTNGIIPEIYSDNVSVVEEDPAVAAAATTAES